MLVVHWCRSAEVEFREIELCDHAMFFRREGDRGHDHGLAGLLARIRCGLALPIYTFVLCRSFAFHYLCRAHSL